MTRLRQIYKFILLCFLVTSISKVVSNKKNEVSSSSQRFVQFVEKEGRISTFISFIDRETTYKGDKIAIVQRHIKPNGSMDYDSSSIERQTLRPIYYYSRLKAGDHIEKFEFTESFIKGEIISKNGMIPQYEEISSPIYNAVTQDELLKSISFLNDTSASYTIYNPGKHFLEVEYKLIGKETLNIRGEKIETLKIEMKGALIPTIIWLSNNSQELIQQKSMLQNGSIFWKKAVID
ncbi:MAG: hypothetical protein BalsKO_06680 [Balneolaceae bacterium]